MRLLPKITAILFLAVAASCSSQTESEKATERSTLNQQAQASLTELYGTNAAARELSNRAEGILVFPSIVEGSFVVGAQTGDGVLFIDGAPVEYYDTSGLSFGLQAGGQAYSQTLMFLTPEALQKFRSSAGFEVGVDGGVTVVDANTAGTLDTNNLRHDIVAFVYSGSGLAAGVALDGTKYTKKDL